MVCWGKSWLRNHVRPRNPAYLPKVRNRVGPPPKSVGPTKSRLPEIVILGNRGPREIVIYRNHVTHWGKSSGLYRGIRGPAGEIGPTHIAWATDPGPHPVTPRHPKSRGPRGNRSPQKSVGPRNRVARSTSAPGEITEITQAEIASLPRKIASDPRRKSVISPISQAPTGNPLGLAENHVFVGFLEKSRGLREIVGPTGNTWDPRENRGPLPICAWPTSRPHQWRGPRRNHVG